MPQKKPTRKKNGTRAAAKTPRTNKTAAAKPAPRRATRKHSATEKPPQLPASYGTQRLHLVARDPRWLYAEWDFTRAQSRTLAKLSADGHLHLRIHRDSFSGLVVAEVELPDAVQHWFLPVARGETRYVAELGYRNAQKNWVAVAQSAPVVTPTEKLAADDSAMFATIPQDVPFKKIIETLGASVAQNIPLVEVIRQCRARLPGFDVFSAARNWMPAQTRELSRIAGIRQIRSRIERELASLTAANIITGRAEDFAPDSQEPEDALLSADGWSGGWSGDWS